MDRTLTRDTGDTAVTGNTVVTGVTGDTTVTRDIAVTWDTIVIGGIVYIIIEYYIGFIHYSILEITSSHGSLYEEAPHSTRESSLGILSVHTMALMLTIVIICSVGE